MDLTNELNEMEDKHSGLYSVFSIHLSIHNFMEY